MAWAVPPLPASLNAIDITVTEVTDELSRGVVEHLYPGRDGADLEDVGQEPRRLQITATVQGPTWLMVLEQLQASVETPYPDLFAHPQFGVLVGKVRRLSITHRDTVHSQAQLRIEFVEGRVKPAAFEVSVTIASAAAGVRTAAAAVTSALAGL